MRLLFLCFGIVVAAAVTLIPETAMYFIYHLIAPQSDLTRGITLAAFWVCGSAVCVGFATLGFCLFVCVTKACLDG